MYKTHFYPLRSVTGNVIEIESIHVIPNQHDHLNFINKLRPGQPDTVNDELYKIFLPGIVKDGISYSPAPGMDTLPIAFPNYVPFTTNSPVGSLFAIPKKKKGNSLPPPASGSVNVGGLLKPKNLSKSYSVTLIIKLKQEALIGGICFAGFPYASSLIKQRPSGSTLANNTLPREIRITPLPRIGPGVGSFRSHLFLDSEFAYSRQEIISHSGYNYLCIDPVKTNLFALTLADFPEIIESINFDEADGSYLQPLPEIKTFFGYAIPYLYFFTYSEKTKSHHRLHTGVLGVKTMIPPDPGEEELLTRIFPEYEFYQTSTDTGIYATFSAHSMFGQKREYPISTIAKRKKLKECFVSDMLEPEEKLTIYLQQGEEYDRCMAGLKVLFAMLPAEERTEKMVDKLIGWVTGNTPDGHLSQDERTLVEDFMAFLLQLPIETDFCEKIGVRIFEIDPPEGVSPAAINADSKYATIITDTIIDTAVEVLFSRYADGIKFRRSSSARYFAIELTNKGDAPGQVCIYSMDIIRSAHVSVQPRASRVQQVKALHYRLIGPSLGEDFSRLGNEGFNFCIDRVIAGQTKNVLYSAQSLLDLLHTGGAKVHINSRRRAVEFEKTEHNDALNQFMGESSKNFEFRKSSNALLTSWRRSETGEDVNFLVPPTTALQPPDQNGNVPAWSNWPRFIRPSDRPGVNNNYNFENYSSVESRIHSKMLFPDTENPDWLTISAFGNMIKAMIDLTGAAESIINQFGSSQLDDFMEFITNLIPNVLLPHYRAASNGQIDELVLSFDKYWKGIPRNEKQLRVTGLVNSTQSPVGISAFAGNTAFEAMQLVNDIPAMVQSLSNAMTGDPGAILEIIPRMRGLIDSIIQLTAITVTSSSGSVSPLVSLPLVNGLNLGITTGVGVNLNSGANTIFPSYQFTANSGSSGAINKSANKTGYSYSQTANSGYDYSENSQVIDRGEFKRLITRKEVEGTDQFRIRGSEVMWQEKIQDIITGSVTLNFNLPATASKSFMRTPDDSLRVRFNSGFTPSVKVDFWFELTEEIINDDY